jgi:hypothetical protein
MNKFRFMLRILAVATFMFALASIAQAQATRTWVSGVGDDANPCSRTAPCKTFAGAISKTAAGGEIDCLDPGGFGVVTITKSITIDGTGTFGSILASGTTGVIVNVSNGRVRLRGLSINGANGTPSPGVDGIRFISGVSVDVEDCVIDGFNTSGINISSSTQSNLLMVRNTVIRNCGVGINITNTGGFTTALELDHVNIFRSGTHAINAGNGTAGSITRSVISGSSGNGINASSGTATFSVTDSTISDNSTGISTVASAHVRIARCLITGNVNAFGLGGAIDTGGNNTIMGNGTNQDPNGTLFVQK